MRAVLLLVLAGCSADVCAPFSGQTCIALEVKGNPSIDQLGISVEGILSRQLTPNPARPTPVTPPVWVAVLPGETFSPTEPMRIFVDALRGGTLVGQALGELQMRPGSHVSAGITLTDLTVTPDMAGADFSGSDLRSLPDLSGGSSQPFFAANNGLFGGEIDTILADFANGSAYAGTGGAGVFKTTNSGATWTAANNGLDAIFINNIVSDDITGTIYLSGAREDRSAALYKSLNAGQSWTRIIDTTSLGPVLATIDSLANSVLFLGLSDGGGILRSTDGANFTAKNVGLTDPVVISLVADPLTKGTIFAGTQGGKVFRTTNFGDSWSDVSTGITAGGGGVHALKFDPHTQDLVAATGNGLFVRLFGQTTFTAYTPTPPLTETLAIDFVQSATPDFYAGGLTGVFHLDGNKTAWNNASAGLTDKSVVSVEIDRTSSLLLYAGTLFGGVFVSTNAATSWSPANQGITNLSVLTVAIDPVNTQVAYAGSQHAGVFRSSNGGTSWSPVNNGLPVGAGIPAIAINPLTPSTLFVATQDTGGLGVAQAVFRSLDSGASWTQVDANAAFSLLIDPSNVMTVYSGTTAGTVRRSIDNGNNFGSLGSMPTGVSSMVIDPANNQILYAGTFSNGVFKSGNGAVSWTPASSGISETQIDSLAIDRTTPTRLWASGFNSIYRSTDAAGSWQQISNGITGQSFNRVAFAGGNQLYTLSTSGIFRSDDGGSSWFHLVGSHVAHDLTVAPNDPNTVYFAHIGLNGVTKTVSGGL